MTRLAGKNAFISVYKPFLWASSPPMTRLVRQLRAHCLGASSPHRAGRQRHILPSSRILLPHNSISVSDWYDLLPRSTIATYKPLFHPRAQPSLLLHLPAMQHLTGKTPPQHHPARFLPRFSQKTPILHRLKLAKPQIFGAKLLVQQHNLIAGITSI